jgi:hypothetical protein
MQASAAARSDTWELAVEGHAGRRLLPAFKGFETDRER